MASKALGSKYGEYAAITMIIMVGALGVLEFGGIMPLTFLVFMGAILATHGIYTLAYLFMRHSSLEKPVKNYMLVWGYLLGAIGLSLVLASAINILLTLSVSLIGLAIVALLILRL